MHTGYQALRLFVYKTTNGIMGCMPRVRSAAVLQVTIDVEVIRRFPTETEGHSECPVLLQSIHMP